MKYFSAKSNLEKEAEKAKEKGEPEKDEAAKAAAERGRSPQARRSGAAEPESTSASGQAAR